MIEIVKVLRAEAIANFRLKLSFSNGWAGERDLSDLVRREGAMVAPLAEPAFFARVFVQNGVPTWPNGFDLDAIALFREMQEAGTLRPVERVAG